MTQTFKTPDGLTIAYEDEGKGLPVIALAGLTRTHRDFDFLAPHLEGVRLIRPDYRGRGGSDWTDWQDYTVPKESGDVVALMDHLGIDKAAFIGTSRGGMNAMFIAATRPDRVIGVCLNDVGPEIARDGLAAIDSYIGRNPAGASLEDVARTRAETAVGFADVPLSRWVEEVERNYDVTPDGIRINYDPALRESYLAAMAAGDADLWPLFDALAGKPLAVIHGQGSDLLTDAGVAAMKAKRPDLMVAEVPGRGHIPFLDEPESLATIQDWIAACR